MQRPSGITKIIVLSLDANVIQNCIRMEFWSEHVPTQPPKTYQNRVLEASGDLLGAFLGASWAILGASWDDLRPPWTPKRRGGAARPLHEGRGGAARPLREGRAGGRNYVIYARP